MNQSRFVKRCIDLLHHPKLLPAIGLISALLALWSLGPQLAIGEAKPLASPIIQLIVSVLIIIAWSAKFLTRHDAITVENNNEVNIESSGFFSDEFQLLRKQCRQVVKYLKNQHLPKFSKAPSRYALPWYLVIGNETVGKSTLMHHAELSFFDTDHFVPQPPNSELPNKICNWWIGRDCIYIDAPGAFLNPTKVQSQGNAGFLALLRNLKLLRFGRPINGLVLVIGLDELLKQDKHELENYFAFIKQQIATAAHQFKKPFPIYLVINKMDLVAGFKEFFMELISSDRQQPWGISFAELEKPDQALSQAFNIGYTKLIKRLQEQLLWRLHQENYLSHRELICEFPAQLENLRHVFTHLIHTLADTANYQKRAAIQGIYFCSATQGVQTVDSLAKSFTSFLPEKIKSTKNNSYVTIDKPYFIHSFLRQLPSFPTARLANSRFGSLLDWNQQFSYVIAFVLLIIMAWIWSSQYHENVRKLHHANRTLVEYRRALNSSTNPSWQTILSSLDALEQVTNNLASIGKPWSFNPNIANTNKAAKELHETYLTTVFAPQLYKQLETDLIKQNTDPNQLYSSLQAYLMLGNPEHADPVWLKTWLKAYIIKNFNSTIAQQLQAQIDHLIDETPVKLITNPAAISQARTILYSQPPALLAYILLRDQQAEQRYTLAPTTQNLDTVPSMYTALQFTKIYSDKIPEVCHEAMYGNWVLGESNFEKLNNADKERLTQQVREIYINDYSNYWNRMTQAIQPKRVNSLTELKNNFKELIKDNSPLTAIFEKIIVNTQDTNLVTAPEITPQDREHIQNAIINPFSTIAKFVHGPDQIRLNTLLNNTYGYLQTIVDSNNPSHAAFLLAKARMQNNQDDPLTALQQMADKTPDPMRNYLHQMTDNGWQLVLTSAHDYLAENWQKKVFEFYNTKLNHRYPFYKTANEEVNLKDFAEFFAPNGILQKFFEDYLKAFVKTNQAQWSWARIDGLPVSNSDEILIQVERGMMIQKLFYNNQGHLQFKFTIAPLAIAPTLHQFVLQLGEQSFVDEIDQPPKMHTLVWPAQDGKGTTILFKTIDNQTLKLSETSPWGLFKMLDKFPPQPTDNPAVYDVTFDLNGNAAKYQLTAPSAFNPFVSGVIEQFRCPEKL